MGKPLDPSQLEQQLLLRIHQGDGGARKEFVAMVYSDMRRLAHVFVSQPSAAHTLHTTALVHEAFLRLNPERDIRINDREHFMAVLSRCMRSVIVDHVRHNHREKRMPSGQRVPLQDLASCFEARTGDLIALDEALKRLECVDPDCARIVEMRFFGDLTVREIANTLGVSTRTVERDWQAARAFLQRELA